MRYPDAIWQPWKATGPGGDSDWTYYRGTNKPMAVVLHLMSGWEHTATDWAHDGHDSASWHFTVGRDGSVLQHLEFADGGFQAGIISPPAPTPTWPLWRGSNGGNINQYSIGIEHEGFVGDPFTPEQTAASIKLCRWLSDTIGFPFDRDHFPCHAEIDLVNRANDFNLPTIREAHYALLFAPQEDAPMTPAELKEHEDLLLALFSGAEEGNVDRATRLGYARYRLTKFIDGADDGEKSPSITEQIAELKH